MADCGDVFELEGELYRCVWWGGGTGIIGAQQLDKHVEDGRHYTNRMGPVDGALYQIEWYRQ